VNFGTTGGTFYGFPGAITVRVNCQLPHIPPGMVCVPAEFLKDALRLTHPDLHSEERQARATKVSAYITQLLRSAG
jgi:hypothetical protein